MNQLNTLLPASVTAAVLMVAIVLIFAFDRQPNDRRSETLLFLTLGATWMIVGIIYFQPGFVGLGLIIGLLGLLLWYGQQYSSR